MRHRFFPVSDPEPGNRCTRCKLFVPEGDTYNPHCGGTTMEQRVELLERQVGELHVAMKEER